MDYRPMAKTGAAPAATVIFFTLGLVCLGEVAFAQQPDSAALRSASSLSALKKLSIEQLMTFEVTSVSKRRQRLDQTAYASQLITAQELRRSGVSSLPEALRLAPT